MEEEVLINVIIIQFVQATSILSLSLSLTFSFFSLSHQVLRIHSKRNKCFSYAIFSICPHTCKNETFFFSLLLFTSFSPSPEGSLFMIFFNSWFLYPSSSIFWHSLFSEFFPSLALEIFKSLWLKREGGKRVRKERERERELGGRRRNTQVKCDIVVKWCEEEDGMKYLREIFPNVKKRAGKTSLREEARKERKN